MSKEVAEPHFFDTLSLSRFGTDFFTYGKAACKNGPAQFEKNARSRILIFIAPGLNPRIPQAAEAVDGVDAGEGLGAGHELFNQGVQEAGGQALVDVENSGLILALRYEFISKKGQLLLDTRRGCLV